MKVQEKAFSEGYKWCDGQTEFSTEPIVVYHRNACISFEDGELFYAQRGYYNDRLSDYKFISIEEYLSTNNKNR